MTWDLYYFVPQTGLKGKMFVFLAFFFPLSVHIYLFITPNTLTGFFPSASGKWLKMLLQWGFCYFSMACFFWWGWESIVVQVVIGCQERFRRNPRLKSSSSSLHESVMNSRLTAIKKQHFWHCIAVSGGEGGSYGLLGEEFVNILSERSNLDQRCEDLLFFFIVS